MASALKYRICLRVTDIGKSYHRS
ncbi:protein of unknown function [Pseudorhizobium banfieldiae]|uniref:Uncharacterized protein n=1 Tax=Pseudorhizobium banfieldiae TaxID=1125847 RepID=L0NCR1_9HYPH|nr:protein of unknown function [Pseudorhizobium banfieldiae]